MPNGQGILEAAEAAQMYFSVEHNADSTGMLFNTCGFLLALFDTIPFALAISAYVALPLEWIFSASSIQQVRSERALAMIHASRNPDHRSEV